MTEINSIFRTVLNLKIRIFIFICCLCLLECTYRYGSSGEHYLAFGEKENYNLVDCGKDQWPDLRKFKTSKIYFRNDNINHKDLVLDQSLIRKWFRKARKIDSKCSYIEKDVDVSVQNGEAFFAFKTIGVENRFPFGSIVKSNGKEYITNGTQCFQAQGVISYLFNDSIYEYKYTLNSRSEEFGYNITEKFDSLCH